jgi:hypothetical protein
MQKGSILIFTLLILSAMLAIAFTLSGIFLAKLKTISEATSSTTAIYAAESAVEVCLYEARKNVSYGRTTLPGGQKTILTNGAFFRIDLGFAGNDVTDSCQSIAGTTFQFRATGTYRGVNRAFEVTQ